MKNADNPITGVITTDSIDYTFYLNDYTLLVLDNIVNSHRTSSLKSTDGFAQVMLHDGTKMLLHIGENNLTIVNKMRLHLASYIMSTANIADYDLSYFDGIEFIGGTLANLKRPMGINIEYESENRRYVEYRDDEQNFDFKTDDWQCDVTIGSSTREQHGLTGSSITNSSIYFRMMFDRKQKTSEVYVHYNKIRQLLSFLVNRQNVGFEKIYLLQKIENSTFWNKVAEVNIQQEKELTTKTIYNNISFEMMDGSLGRLLNIFYSPIERKKSYSLGFHYEDDKSAGQIGSETVREVCSALECELGLIPKMMSDESTKIRALTRQLQQVINEHKKSKDKLRDKTYSLIESSMSHWTMSASDQIKLLFHMYQQEMWAIAKPGRQCSDDGIDNFVKYRNDITHGSYRVMNPEVAYTTYLLACLVYCCVLTRIGVPRETILQWCKDKRLMN